MAPSTSQDPSPPLPLWEVRVWTVWWKNEQYLPYWSTAAQKALLIQLSSAAAERAFSLLNASFTAQQNSYLEDYIEIAIMLQFNKHLLSASRRSYIHVYACTCYLH